MAKGLSAAKAKKILTDGYVKGKPLTAKQRKYFGAIADGATPLKKINGSGGVPKAQGGKILKWFKDMYDGAKKFDSSIDWRKWVKYTEDFDNNPDVIKHLNEIEKTTKGNGTWMKNPDGSAFKGTQEEFVVQQSDNFKNAFGDSKLLNPDGSPIKLYHGSPKNFEVFDESMFQLGDSGYSGSGIYTTPNKGGAESYTISGRRHHSGKMEPTLYELYGRGNNPITSKQLIDNSGGDIGFGKIGERKDKNLPTDLFNFHRDGTPTMEQLLKYDVAIKNQQRGISDIRPIENSWEIVFPTNKQLKSTKGNILFDMANPNIYKAIVPGAIGAGAVSQMGPKQEDGQFKNGGWLDKYEDEELLKAQNGIPKFKLSDQKLNIDERATNLQIQDAVSKPETLRVIPELSEENYSVTSKQPIVRQSNDMVSAYEKPDMYDKLTDILASPLTSLGYLSSGQDIPDALPLGMENRSPHDALLDMFNPFAMAKYAVQSNRSFENAGPLSFNSSTGGIDGMGEYTDAGFEALGAIPIVPGFLGYGKYAKNIKQIPKNKALFNQYEATGKNLNSQITKLKNLENNYNIRQGELLAKYKAKKITAEDYSKQVKSIQPWDSFENPIPALQKQLRELNVKKEILNTPQKNILKNEKQLGKNISDGGTNNKGVFELNDNYVARLSAHGYDDASRLVNYSNKLSSPRIMKTHQVKEINGKVYQVQDKATGVPYTQLSEKQLKALPKNHIDNFHKDIIELEKNGLSIDISGGKSNIFYDPKKGFQFIDLGIGEMPNINDIKKVVKFKNGGLLNKYQMGGSLPGASGMMYSRTSGSPLIEPGKLKKAQTGITKGLTREDFVNNLKTGMSNNLLYELPDQGGMGGMTNTYISDDGEIDTTTGLNCINGVCQMTESLTGKDFTGGIQGADGNYVGNQTFNSNLEKEGYYNVQVGDDNPYLDFGDVVQASKFKYRASRAKNKRPVGADRHTLIPQHAYVVGDIKYDENGKPVSYDLYHNSGDKEIIKRTLSQKDFEKRMKKGWKHQVGQHAKQYDGYIVNRYDPSVISDRNKLTQAETYREDQYESLYDNASNPVQPKDLEGINKEYPKLGKVFEYLNNNYVELGKLSDVPKPVFDQMVKYQIGLAGKETRFGDDEGFPIDLGGLNDLGRGVKGMVMDTSSPDAWYKDAWLKNANNVQSKYSSVEEYKEATKANLKAEKEKKLSTKWKNKEAVTAISNLSDAKSVGMYQQKEISKKGKEWGLKKSDIKGNPTNQFKASLALMIDNYERLKKQYPDKSDDELVYLSAASHNAPGKVSIPDYANFYGPNKDINYVNTANRIGEAILNTGDIKRRTKKAEDIEAFATDEDKLDSIVDNKYLVNEFNKDNFEIPDERLQSLKSVESTQTRGWLDKYEDGGEVEKAQNGNFGGVNTDVRTTSGESAYDDTVYPDDPNYDAKYKETYEGGAFASMPNQLDEVVLNSGVDYEKYPLYDDLSEQDRQYFKDDGAIGRGVRRRAQTKKGLAEDTYDVVNPLMYGMLGVAGGMIAGPSIANLTRAAAPYVASTARTIGNSPVGVGIRKALNYKPMGGPASLGNMMDAGFADMALRDTPEMYDAFKENPNWDTGTDLALTASDLIPYGEIATGFKGTRRLINSAANKFNDLTSLKPNFTPIERVVEDEAGRLKSLFNQPNIYPTSSPLPKRMEPYLSQREIPISKEEELLQSTFDWNDPEKLKHYNDELESRLIRYNQKGEVIPKQKQGGVIKDDMGQWAHPGEVTEISGNTMATHGYGDNPLYVVPDVGEPRVVEANTGTQTFPGATKFTEYPMAKNGSSLVELNQLTNFTNYNTPQPGGWLDKYN